MSRSKKWGRRETINRCSIIKTMHDALRDKEVSKADVRHAVNALLSKLREALLMGDKIELRGILVAKPSVRAARKGREILKMREVSLPEKKSYRWRLSKGLEAEIAERGECAK